MPIKKFLFTLPLAFMALFFVFCAKEQMTPVAEALPNGGIVGDRTTCNITVTINNGGSIALCGVQTTATACGNVGGLVLRGTDQFAGAGASRNYVINFPNGAVGTFFQVAGIVAAVPVSVTVTSANGSSVTFSVGGGLPIRNVGVDSNCNVF